MAAVSQLTPEELDGALPIMRRLAGDFWLFWTSCVQTLDEHETDPALSISKPAPRYAYLKRLADAMVANRRVIVLKSRQMLASWLMCAWAVYRALFFNGNRVLFLTIREKDAYKIGERVRHILKHLPEVIQAALDNRVTDNDGELAFEGGSAIQFLASSENPGRSLTATDVIMDEHAFHRWDLKMYAAIKPTLSGGGNAFSLSTPNGVGNLFHALWVGAQRAGDDWNGYTPVELDWREHPDHDQAWYDDTTRDMPSRLVAQEYDRNFLQSGAVVFDQSHLKLGLEAWVVDVDLPIPDAVMSAIAATRRRTRGAAFWIGVDTADGVVDGDFSVATVLEAISGRQVATLTARIRPDLFAAKLAKLARVFFPGPIGVEKSSSGGTVILELERLGLGDRIYRHRDWDERGRMKTRRGWNTTAKSKPLMIDELEVAIRRRDVILSSKVTLDECLVYEYKETTEHSGAPTGYHDDHVMALAIAWQMRKAASGSLTAIG